MRSHGTHPLVEKSPNIWESFKHARLLSEMKIETQVKFSDEAKWQSPVFSILIDVVCECLSLENAERVPFC